MLKELLDLLRREGIRGTRSLGFLLDRLEGKDKRKFLRRVEALMADHALLDSSRVDSLITILMADESSGEEDEQDNGEDNAA